MTAGPFKRELFDIINKDTDWIKFWRTLLENQEILDIENQNVKCVFHNDDKASMTVSKTGLYHCKACNEAGNGITFIKKFKNIPGYKAVEWLCTFSGIDINKYRETTVKKPTEKDVVDCHNRLLSSTDILKTFMEKRLITIETIKKYKIGWLVDRFTIPIYDEKGKLLNIRRYMLGNTDGMKTLPWVTGLDENERSNLFPLQEMDKPWILLLEGEMDCLLALSLGLPGITATGGATTWKPAWNKWFKGKKVVICYDDDDAGVKGSAKVCNNLIGVVDEIKNIRLKGNKKGYDFTDYITDGNSIEDFLKMAKETPTFQPQIEKKQDDSPYSKVHLSQASLAKYYDQRIEVDAIVSGKGLAPFVLPQKVRFACSPGTDKSCQICPVGILGGELEYKFSREDINLVSLINFSIVGQVIAIRKRLAIPTTCRKVDMTTVEPINIEEIRLIPPIDFSDDADTHYVARDCYYIGHGIEPNRQYIFRGKTLPHPKTQHATHLMESAETSSDNIAAWKMTPEIFEQLKKFKPEKQDLKSISNKFTEIYNEFELITGIRDRHELFFIIDLSYHSVLRLKFQGKQIKGWVEVLVVGDTRQGKSIAGKGLLKHYRAGEFIGGESLSVAGLKGGISQGASGWSLNWGRMPLNNRRLVYIDEGSGMSVDVWGELSSMRSEGVAEIVKVRTERTMSAVRLIVFSNPRSNRKLSQYTHGVLAIQELIGKPEDISRFDCCLTVASGEVDQSKINMAQNVPERIHYDSDSCHNLVMFAWSRTKDNVKFSKETTDAILSFSNAISKRYSSRIPIVEPSEQRIKIARLAVSVAVRMFSTDDGENIIVLPSHVEYVTKMLDKFYSKPSMGYRDYSISILSTEEIGSKELVLKTFHSSQADLMLRNPVFNQTDLTDILQIEERAELKKVIFVWLKNNAIVKQKNNSYRFTPAMIELLKEVQAQEKDDGIGWNNFGNNTTSEREEDDEF